MDTEEEPWRATAAALDSMEHHGSAPVVGEREKMRGRERRNERRKKREERGDEGASTGVGLCSRGWAGPGGWRRLDPLLDRELRGRPGSGAMRGRLRSASSPLNKRSVCSVVAWQTAASAGRCRDDETPHVPPGAVPGAVERRLCRAEMRPDGSRYGDNPNRLQRHPQFQVILKPGPGNSQDLFVHSLSALCINVREHDIRSVEDNWESPGVDHFKKIQ